MIYKEPALVLFSGGQDSTTCLYWAIEHFKSVRTLCFTYGQKHSKEIEVAEELAKSAGVDFQLLDASIISQLSQNSLTSSDMEMDEEQPEGGVPNTFVPGRNLLFLTFAGVIAHQHGIKHIVTGVSEADYSGYPDCRHNFILSANTSINLAMDTNFRIHAPLMNLDKSDVWELADKLGAFDTVRNKTLTCYNGVIAEGCGHCPACKLRNEGLEKYLKRREK